MPVSRLAASKPVLFPSAQLLKYSENKRSPYERYLAKVMRLRAGLPDLMLPLAQGRHSGLGIELKIKPNKPTADQKTVGENSRDKAGRWRCVTTWIRRKKS